MPPQQSDERTRLLRNGQPNGHAEARNANSQESNKDTDDDDAELVDFDGEDDEEDPHNWPNKIRYLQVLLIFIIGLVCPMSSSMHAPAIEDIKASFDTSKQVVIAAQAGFVCMLGIGPLFFAPMSETFGRRPIFLGNLAMFTLMQIPSALAPNIESFIVFRTLSGFFGSVGVANGGGTVSDLFRAHERATVLGCYLLAPLLGPTLGPFVGGLISAHTNWRWLFWFQLILSAVVWVICYFLLYETCGPIVLQFKKQKLEEENEGKKYKIKGQSDTSIGQKISGNATRACKILFRQPIVLVMSTYQALIFSTMYSLYTNYSSIWSNPPYDFNKIQVSISYLAPAVGFCLTAAIVVPFIDRIYNRLSQQNDGEGKPEYRLPLANIGALCLPISLLWFGWTVEYEYNWPVPLSAMLFFGASQVSIFNTVQNYYIDAFENMAASALAAGAFLRSVVGGIVPLFVPMLFDKVGYGWGMSVFGIMAVLLMPAPALFYWYGQKIREKYPLKL